MLGADHTDTLRSAHNLACELRALGEPQPARALDDETLIHRRRVLGDNHPDTCTPRINVAVDYRLLGNHHRPTNCMPTRWPASGKYSVTIIPTRCARPTTSPPTSARWASTPSPASSTKTP